MRANSPNNESICIIPDIHNKIHIADRIIKNCGADKVIFLGDFFDDFYDSPSDAKKVAQWLKKSLNYENRIHLFGNHDIAYCYPNNPYTKCSGWESGKQTAIDSILTKEDWGKLKFFHIEQGWIFSHAGIHPSFLNTKVPTPNIGSFLKKESQKAIRSLESGKSHWFFRAGYSRGGDQSFGGLTWLDFRQEFEPIEGLKTVQGHTPLAKPQWDGDNLCLDTHLFHYAILSEGKIQIMEYADL